jgi:hypothetical protein
MIEVDCVDAADPLAFTVLVKDEKGETRHLVSLARADARRLGGENPPEQVITAAFRFLLDRQPKEQILARFDVSLIARYFPEFEQRLPAHLAQA